MESFIVLKYVIGDTMQSNLHVYMSHLAPSRIRLFDPPRPFNRTLFPLLSKKRFFGFFITKSNFDKITIKRKIRKYIDTN